MFEGIKHIFIYDTKMNRVSHLVTDADTVTDFIQTCKSAMLGNHTIQWNEVTDLEGVVNSLREVAKGNDLPSMIVFDKKDIIIYCPTKRAEEVMQNVFADYNVNYLGNEIDFFKDMYSVDMELSD